MSNFIYALFLSATSSIKAHQRATRAVLQWQTAQSSGSTPRLASSPVTISLPCTQGPIRPGEPSIVPLPLRTDLPSGSIAHSASSECSKTLWVELSVHVCVCVCVYVCVCVCVCVCFHVNMCSLYMFLSLSCTNMMAHDHPITPLLPFHPSPHSSPQFSFILHWYCAFASSFPILLYVVVCNF